MESRDMTSKNPRWSASLLSLFLCLNLCGCGYFQATSNDEEIELTDAGEPDEDVFESGSRISRPPESSANALENEPKLKIGDQFRFLKTVEHRLTQIDSTETRISTSRTTIALMLTVNNILSDGRKQFSVDFQDVEYEQDLNGKRVRFSSGDPDESLPPEAMLYAGLTHNGFSFWVGVDNSVQDVIGFDDFLRRCVRTAPGRFQAMIHQQLESMKSEDAVADFIDAGIGILPFSSDHRHPGISLQRGAIWELNPRLDDRPIRVETNTSCLLKEVTAQSAEILLTSRIQSSPRPLIMTDPEGDLRISVKGGSCTGFCRISLRSGLPINSRMQRSLELQIELPDGQTLQQFKDTVNTLASIDGAQQTPKSPDVPGVHQSGLQNGNRAGSETSNRVVPAGFSRQN